MIGRANGHATGTAKDIELRTAEWPPITNPLIPSGVAYRAPGTASSHLSAAASVDPPHAPWALVLVIAMRKDEAPGLRRPTCTSPSSKGSQSKSRPLFDHGQANRSPKALYDI